MRRYLSTQTQETPREEQRKKETALRVCKCEKSHMATTQLLTDADAKIALSLVSVLVEP